jgi:hypothetical protein
MIALVSQTRMVGAFDHIEGSFHEGGGRCDEQATVPTPHLFVPFVPVPYRLLWASLES